VRKDQDLAAEAETLDKAIISAVSKEPAKRDAAGEQGIRDRLATITKERDELQKVFAAEFPDYAALSKPEPLAANDIQRLLSSEEVLIAFSVGAKESYVFVVTRDAAEWQKFRSAPQQSRKRSLPCAAASRSRWWPTRRTSMESARSASCSTSPWPTTSTLRSWGRSKR